MVVVGSSTAMNVWPLLFAVAVVLQTSAECPPARHDLAQTSVRNVGPFQTVVARPSTAASAQLRLYAVVAVRPTSAVLGRAHRRVAEQPRAASLVTVAVGPYIAEPVRLATRAWAVLALEALASPGRAQMPGQGAASLVTAVVAFWTVARAWHLWSVVVLASQASAVAVVSRAAARQPMLPAARSAMDAVESKSAACARLGARAAVAEYPISAAAARVTRCPVVQLEPLAVLWEMVVARF